MAKNQLQLKSIIMGKHAGELFDHWFYAICRQQMFCTKVENTIKEKKNSYLVNLKLRSNSYDHLYCLAMNPCSRNYLYLSSLQLLLFLLLVNPVASLNRSKTDIRFFFFKRFTSHRFLKRDGVFNEDTKQQFILLHQQGCGDQQHNHLSTQELYAEGDRDESKFF